MNNNQPTKKDIICTCTGTTKSQIEQLRDNGMDTFEKIAHQTGAGTGCGSCDYLIAELLTDRERTIS